ncbi:hypothetical protein F4859DRAFT_466453 [Xylaria cf. heliscus]|nr:hypothetical protein F4859DRAFT_466453 [Xylaria cf. heliscus]
MASPDFRAHVSEADSAKPPASPWSCFPCRRRKIRCDRRYPCSNCLKGELDCGFPVSGRTPTRRYDLPSFASRKEKQNDLLDRLRRLEGFVAKIGTELEGGTHGDGISSREGIRAMDLPNDGSQSSFRDKHREKTDAELAHVTHELGTLVMNDNESLYVGNWLWGVICDEVKHIRQAVEDDDIESEPLEKRILRPSIQGVPFFWGSTNAIYENLQPLPSQISYIWETFVENVDPFIKVLHVPTVGKMLKEAKGKFNSMARGMEALMFAISLAAVTSLQEDEVRDNFGEDRKTLLARLRHGTEQALSRAGVLNTTDVGIVQALIIYQEIVKEEDGQRASWTLAGLLTRIATGMGLHRDGSHFPNVPPFDAEIRRRVWYNLCFLDSRVGDCQVFNVGITENLFDTKPPSNLNDTDITPDMTFLPASKDGCTDSTLCILRCKIWHFARGFRSLIATEPVSNESTLIHQLKSLTEIRKIMAKELKQYLKSGNSQFHLLIRTTIAVELTRFDHIIHVANNFKSPDGRDESHKAFALAIASLEHIFRLTEQPATAQWNWYLYSFVQWHTMSTVLVRLSTSPWGPMSEAAWALAKKAFVHLSEGMSRDPMRQPLPDLMRSVARHRELQIEKLRANPSLASKLAKIGAIPSPISQLRDFSDGRETFDTSAAEERLALEIKIAIGESETSSTNSTQTFSGSEWGDMWVDLTPSFLRTDESDCIPQSPQSRRAYNSSVMNQDMEEHLDLSSSGEYQGLMYQGPWEQRADPYVSSNYEEMGWLAWTNIPEEGMP